MRRIAMWSAAAVLPAVLISALVGCGGSTTTSGEAAPPPKDNPGGGGKLTAIVAKDKDTGTIKGKVTFKGDKAALKLAEATKTLQEEMAKKDELHCIKEAPEDQKDQQTWRIAEDGGLKNVIVYLKPPQGKYFAVDLDKAKFEKKKVLDQPHCAFVPHVLVLFPEYRTADNTKAKPTGQEFIIENTAKMGHNTNIEALGFNKSIEPNSKLPVEDVKLNNPLTIKCTIHPFMTGYALQLNHPYAAVTNEKGEFEIADVPADVEVLVTVWHEAGASKDYEKGKEMKLKTGETKLEITVEPK